MRASAHLRAGGLEATLQASSIPMDGHWRLQRRGRREPRQQKAALSIHSLQRKEVKSCSWKQGMGACADRRQRGKSKKCGDSQVQPGQTNNEEGNRTQDVALTIQCSFVNPSQLISLLLPPLQQKAAGTSTCRARPCDQRNGAAFQSLLSTLPGSTHSHRDSKQPAHAHLGQETWPSCYS